MNQCQDIIFKLNINDGNFDLFIRTFYAPLFLRPEIGIGL